MSVDERSGLEVSTGHPEFSRLKDALHTPFEFRLDDTGSVHLMLEEVTSGNARPGWESFSLVFGGASPPVFLDGLFDVEHPELGSFPIFVVAVKTDGDGQQYQAVFNRRAT